MLVFRQLFDAASSTYSYLLGDRGSGEAVLIDPVFEHALRDTALVRELGLRLVAVLETHVHADHVTGAWLLKQRCGSRIVVAAAAGTRHADQPVVHGDRIAFGARHLEVRATPGHTDGCVTYVLDDCSMAFTGDCLLVRGTGRTDFQQGDAERLFRSVREQIFSLPPACLLYPAHDYRGLTVSSVEEERRFNPRLGGNAAAGDFSEFMRNLGLPHPKLIDIAVPANLHCGRPSHEHDMPAEQDWAPLTWTFAGYWEIQPAALEEVARVVQIVDVREPAEHDHPGVRIADSRLIPLSQLTARVGELQRDRPIVTVCRAGARSVQAVSLLKAAGFPDCANLAGGLLRWRTEGHPVVSMAS